VLFDISTMHIKLFYDNS